jgi:hypothetical protein
MRMYVFTFGQVTLDHRWPRAFPCRGYTRGVASGVLAISRTQPAEIVSSPV